MDKPYQTECRTSLLASICFQRKRPMISRSFNQTFKILQKEGQWVACFFSLRPFCQEWWNASCVFCPMNAGKSKDTGSLDHDFLFHEVWRVWKRRRRLRRWCRADPHRSCQSLRRRLAGGTALMSTAELVGSSHVTKKISLYQRGLEQSPRSPDWFRWYRYYLPHFDSSGDMRRAQSWSSRLLPELPAPLAEPAHLDKKNPKNRSFVEWF